MTATEMLYIVVSVVLQLECSSRRRSTLWNLIRGVVVYWRLRIAANHELILLWYCSDQLRYDMLIYVDDLGDGRELKLEA